MKDHDIDPIVRKFFPWALFLVLALVLALGAKAHGEEDVWACYGAQRYQAMSSAWPACNEMSTLCLRVRQYLGSHTEAEGRAKAVELNAPAWLVRRAEKCIP